MDPTVLDLAQLARIQGTHRGFLYQHLYAVACLLLTPTSGVVRVRVERDEDVELVHPSRTVYAQIKTRATALAPSDIVGLLDRFDEIRAAHASGKRDGVARFALVSNAELGPSLAAASWPSDMIVVTPTTLPETLEGTGLLAPTLTIPSLLEEALRIAERYRLSALRPDSLIAKLVGVIAQAAAGEWTDQAFAAEDLERLCELVAAQVRPLPVVERYLPQRDEPDLRQERALVVLGHPGSGKSAWASEVAMHSSEVAVYLPCSSAPGEQLAARLVDAVVGTLVARGDVRAHELILPGRTGLEALALLNSALDERDIRVMAVVDDCHHMSTQQVVEAMRAAPLLRWLFVGHPSGALAEVAALSAIRCESLGGWDEDVIAGMLKDAGCSTRPEDVAALRRATSGAPLFVIQAVREISSSSRDTGAYAAALVSGATIGRSPQEIVLDGAVRSLDVQHGRVASALASVDAGLRVEEWGKVLSGALGESSVRVRGSLRALVDLHIAAHSGRGIVAVHDAFRPLLVERFLSSEETRKVRERTADVLCRALLEEHAGERIVAYARILASLGRLSQLADLANALSEWLRETGTIGQVRGYLEAALDQSVLADDDRFWAIDTLAFLDVEDGKLERAASRFAEMTELACRLDEHARAAVVHKEVLVAMRSGDLATVRKLVANAPVPQVHSRSLRYHGALAEAEHGHARAAIEELLEIASEYLDELGLVESELFRKGPEDLRKMLRPTAEGFDVRHLADCYDAIARIARGRIELRRMSPFAPVWAMKFYELAGALRSVLRAGQEVVDMMLGEWDDPDEARRFCEESLLPAVAKARLPEMAIPIRAQFAVICAHCGDFAAADATMALLEPYTEGLRADVRAELENQRDLIEHLRARGPLPPDALAARRDRIARQKHVAELLVARQDAAEPGGKIGRNALCPCGSGKKYKRCCGAG